MAKSPSRTAFKRAFIARVKAAREARGKTQEQMTDLFGMRQDRYKQYETRSYLPHDLVGAFCQACEIEPADLYAVRSRLDRAKRSAA